jgi:hypothetical protein
MLLFPNFFLHLYSQSFTFYISLAFFSWEKERSVVTCVAEQSNGKVMKRFLSFFFFVSLHTTLKTVFSVIDTKCQLQY